LKMAIKVPTAQEAAKKWGDVTPGRQGYYQAGAAAAGGDWEKNTVDAAAAYKNAISAGNIQQMFTGGVKKAGASKYTRKINDVGAGRFSSGVSAAVSDMASGIEPMLSTIASVTLPARQPRGSAANLQRVSAVADALNKKRLSLRAAGA
jgi:hypothetical protein